MAIRNSIQKEQLLRFIGENPLLLSTEIAEKGGFDFSLSTLKRLLSDLTKDQLVEIVGNRKSSRYRLSPCYSLVRPIDLEDYFSEEIDDRAIIRDFNHELFTNQLANCSLFNETEQIELEQLHQRYFSKIKDLPEEIYKKELERLAIDLSWKSSQIEGNTYSLLETERLLKEKETAAGKTKDEATMLLNHKEALDFIIEHPDYLKPISVARIEDIHSLLVKELNIDRNIRKRRVGISGTNYKPLDNEHQIREALESMCYLINQSELPFSKAFLALILLSYIQAFNDGNKRTARIVSNAILMQYGFCPISFRTVDAIEYKKAMLVFYEQNNISAFKKIFIDQYAFAVETYF